MNNKFFQLRKRMATSVRGLAFVGAIALTAFLNTGSTLEASSVTLRFEGEVVGIEELGNPLLDLPTEIAIGRPASLELTFEPIPFPKAARTIGPFIAPGGNIALRPLGLKLVLNEIVLADDAATLLVVHDPFRSRTGNSGGGVLEQESIGVRGVGIIPNTTLLSWATSGGFANMGSVLNGGESLSDPEVWNLLPLRSITTVFDGPGTGLIHVTTAFGDASVVPEPSSMSCAAMIALIIGAFHLVSRSRFAKQ